MSALPLRGLALALIPLAIAGCVSPMAAKIDPTPDIGETLGKREAPPEEVLPIIRSEPIAADPGKAIENYRKLLELQSADDATRDESRRRLADLQVQVADAEGNTEAVEGDLRDSIKQYDRLLKDNPDSPDNDRIYYQRARALQNLGDTPAAIDTLATMTARHPDSRLVNDARFRRAELLFFEARYAEAESEYGIVLAQGAETPFFEPAQYKYGWSRYKQGKYTEAVDVFVAILDHVLPQDASFFDPTLVLAQVRGTQADYAKDALRVISLSFANLGGGTAANDYFAQAGDPRFFPLVYVSLGDQLLERQRFTDAAEASAAFVTRYPQHALAPDFQSRVISAYDDGGFNDLVVREKARYAETYDPAAPYWAGNRPSNAVLGTLRIHLADLARHFYAKGQQMPEEEQAAAKTDFLTAAGYFRRILEVYPNDGEIAEINFLLAESLLNGGELLTAAEEYARTAYDYPRHVRSADAAHASVLAYHAYAEAQVDTQREPALRQAIDAALRFADTYPGHGQLLPVLTRAAEDLYELQDYDRAITVAKRVLDYPPPVDYRLRRNAWSVTGNSHFAQERFAEAEQAFVQELELVSEKATERPEIIERLAEAVYRQGERSRDEGALRQAAFHFLRVKTVAPNAGILATADYDGASMLFELEDWPEASRELEGFRSRYPQHALLADIDKKLAVAYQRNGQPFQAAEVFSRIFTRETESAEIRQDAAWLSATLFDEADAGAEMTQAYERYVTAYPRPVDRAMTARSRLVELTTTAGDRERQLFWLRQIVSADAGAGAERSDATRLAAAESSLAIGRMLAADTAKLALTLPLENSLPPRRQSMETAIQSLTQAAGFGFAEVTTAATFELGKVYYDFAKALMASERPRNLDALALEQFELLLEEQAFPFEERAIETFETNLKRISQGIYDEWIRNSYQQLVTIAPGLYGRVERGEAVYEPFN